MGMAAAVPQLVESDAGRPTEAALLDLARALGRAAAAEAWSAPANAGDTSVEPSSNDAAAAPAPTQPAHRRGRR